MEIETLTHVTLNSCPACQAGQTGVSKSDFYFKMISSPHQCIQQDFNFVILIPMFPNRVKNLFSIDGYWICAGLTNLPYPP